MTTDPEDGSAQSAEAVVLGSEFSEASTSVVHSWSRHTSILLTEIVVVGVLVLGLVWAETFALGPVALIGGFGLLLEVLRRRAKSDLQRSRQVESDLAAAIDSLDPESERNDSRS